MKIPKKIKIGGHTVKVDCSKELIDEEGFWESKKGKISICSKLPQTHKEATLIHEIFHVINTTLDGDKIGHSLLDSLSEQFYQVLKDNKLLNEK
jgi:hypothetical protein